ncbi:MAG: phage antirepressor KilAC domain-containing protein [Janthinobacterium lividum]
MHNQIAPRNTPADSSVSAISQNMTRQTMSSREIADLTGKAHKHVLADIRTMLTDLEIDWAEFSAQYKDGTGRSLPCFNLDRELTDTLLTGYSAKMRLAVVRRWRELEDQAQQPRLPNNFAEALQVAADQARESQRLHLVIEEQAPKVAALEQLASTRGSICITEAAKHLGMGPLKLFTWMASNRWIYRRTSFANWSAFQPRLTAGLLEHKLVNLKNNETDELKVVEQVMVTRRGLVVLAEKIGAAL